MLAKSANYNSPNNWENCSFTMSDAILVSEFLVAPGGVIRVPHCNLPNNMKISKIINLLKPTLTQLKLTYPENLKLSSLLCANSNFYKRQSVKIGKRIVLLIVNP